MAVVSVLLRPGQCCCSMAALSCATESRLPGKRIPRKSGLPLAAWKACGLTSYLQSSGILRTSSDTRPLRSRSPMASCALKLKVKDASAATATRETWLRQEEIVG